MAFPCIYIQLICILVYFHLIPSIPNFYSFSLASPTGSCLVLRLTFVSVWCVCVLTSVSSSAHSVCGDQTLGIGLHLPSCFLSDRLSYFSASSTTPADPRPPISSWRCQDCKPVPPPPALCGFWRFELKPLRLGGKRFAYLEPSPQPFPLLFDSTNERKTFDSCL